MEVRSWKRNTDVKIFENVFVKENLTNHQLLSCHTFPAKTWNRYAYIVEPVKTLLVWYGTYNLKTIEYNPKCYNNKCKNKNDIPNRKRKTTVVSNLVSRNEHNWLYCIKKQCLYCNIGFPFRCACFIFLYLERFWKKKSCRMPVFTNKK